MLQCCPYLWNFNPRSREGSDAVLSESHNACSSDFNPRSREGSDVQAGFVDCHHVLFQSTLPRRERPFRLDVVCNRHLISIHAPAKGATLDHNIDNFPGVISIHAPAKGATQIAADKSSQIVFQSTLPRREQLVAQGGLEMAAQFQSTLPRRERRVRAGRIAHSALNFNPRSREGSDGIISVLFSLGIRISIHAPAKGAT